MTNNAIPGPEDLTYPALGPGMPEGTGIIMNGWCRWCSSELSKVYHGGRCPEVEEIEYFETGRVRRVKFRSGS